MNQNILAVCEISIVLNVVRRIVCPEDSYINVVHVSPF